MKSFNQAQKNSGSLTNKEAINIDYKNVQMLQKYISETGKILPRRVTLASTKTQRKLAKAIKAARSMALLPYNNE